MNAKLTVSALLLAAFAGSALADDPTVVDEHFVSGRSRAEVQAEYLASRGEVRALTGEDSGSAYLAQARGTSLPVSTLAGTPVNAR